MSTNKNHIPISFVFIKPMSSFHIDSSSTATTPIPNIFNLANITTPNHISPYPPHPTRGTSGLSSRRTPSHHPSSLTFNVPFIVMPTSTATSTTTSTPTATATPTTTTTNRNHFSETLDSFLFSQRLMLPLHHIDDTTTTNENFTIRERLNLICNLLPIP